MNRAERRRAEREQDRPAQIVPKLVVPDAPRKGIGEKVVWGWISSGSIDAQTTISIANSQNYDAWCDEPLFAGNIGLESSPRIVEARTQVIETFLTDQRLRRPDNGMPCEWLFTVDGDMDWEEDAIHKMVTRCHEENLWVLGGLCFAGNRKEMYPTIYGEDSNGQVVKMKDYPRDATVKVAATGAAFMLIHRDVLLKVRAAYGRMPDPQYANPHPWYVEGINAKGEQWGEDIAFCKRIRSVGYDVWVDTRIKVGHMKRYALNEALYDEARDREAVLAELANLRAENEMLRRQQVRAAGVTV